MNYKKLQRLPQETIKVIWISCMYHWGLRPGMLKRSHQKSYVVREELDKLKGKIRGKAAIKRAKALTHSKGFYRKQREANA